KRCPARSSPGRHPSPKAYRRRPRTMNLRATVGRSGQYLGVLLVPILIALAVAVGFALGGRLSRFEHLRINRWGLAIAAVALQFLPGGAIGRVPATVAGPGMLATSDTLLLLFLLWNRWIPGTWLMAIGLLLNLLVVMVNGGMPVQP